VASVEVLEGSAIAFDFGGTRYIATVEVDKS
jgi:hypothetical protein